jgi:hypothetical protein
MYSFKMQISQNCRTCGEEIPAGRIKYCEKHPSVSSNTSRSKRQQRSEEGVCISCSSPICAGSTIFCEEHLLANRKRGAEDRKRRKELGLCRSCNNPISKNSTTWCENHHSRQNENSRVLAAKRRADEKCIDCNKNTRVFRIQRCSDCQEIYKSSLSTKCRRIKCDVTAVANGLCREHADLENLKLKERRAKLKKDNRCIYCFREKSESDKDNTLCFDCRESQKEGRNNKVGTRQAVSTL